jgi:hypothetical protein
MKQNSIKKMVAWLFDTFLRDFRKFPKVLNYALMSLNRTSRLHFYTYHERPKAAAEIHLDGVRHETLHLAPTAVVIQGPLVGSDNFTLETVRLYRRLMPQALLVVSTWRSTSPVAIEQLRAEGADVVLSDPPAVSGGHNINFQMISTSAGIRHARQAGCEYVIKTRTDQRFHAHAVLPYLFALLEEYPSIDPARQRQRIIELSLSICRYRPYSMCDMFQFGHVDDLLAMWELPLDPRSHTAAEYALQQITPRRFAEDRTAEVYVHRGYLEAIGERTEVDLATYYRHMADYFIVIDKEAVDLFWNKYEAREYGLAVNPLYQPWRPTAKFFSRDWHVVRKFGAAALDTNPALMDVAEN